MLYRREYQLELDALNNTFTKLFEQVDKEEASIKNEISQLYIDSQDFDENLLLCHFTE